MSNADIPKNWVALRKIEKSHNYKFTGNAIESSSVLYVECFDAYSSYFIKFYNPIYFKVVDEGFNDIPYMENKERIIKNLHNMSFFSELNGDTEVILELYRDPIVSQTYSLASRKLRHFSIFLSEQLIDIVCLNNSEIECEIVKDLL